MHLKWLKKVTVEEVHVSTYGKNNTAKFLEWKYWTTN